MIQLPHTISACNSYFYNKRPRNNCMHMELAAILAIYSYLRSLPKCSSRLEIKQAIAIIILSCMIGQLKCFYDLTHCLLVSPLCPHSYAPDSYNSISVRMYMKLYWPHGRCNDAIYKAVGWVETD